MNNVNTMPRHDKLNPAETVREAYHILATVMYHFGLILPKSVLT
ncbi:MAG: hypothetical protein Nkreftii_001948 [Candidatus Nitrospira kreftii]|uniref:Transposase n=1 Tax=Candidatus Nitrospira kreftii TaxID=2652173 RepID=A0A7S8FDP5_9BACT|nr:MAG: hypothetical protein Nkreftii_001948 [Candidatus Nitrospira kreftii]